MQDEIIEANDLNKVHSIVAGGYDRQKSVYNGLKEVNNACKHSINT